MSLIVFVNTTCRPFNGGHYPGVGEETETEKELRTVYEYTEVQPKLF